MLERQARPDSDRATRGRWIGHLTPLDYLDMSGDHQAPCCAPRRFQRRLPVFSSNESCGFARAHGGAGRTGIEQFENCVFKFTVNSANASASARV